tara:strand:- start:2459 stop:2947 length:489 start_codon:yes stop_codon:yes gene_type:complete
MPSSKEYIIANKDRINAKQRLDYQKNKEKRVLEQRSIRSNYSEERKEELRKQCRERPKTEKNKKCQRIGTWCKRGLHIDENINDLYIRYINCKECEWCHKEVKKQLMEHNHTSGECRGIVCNSCNCKIAKKDSDFQKVMYELTRYHLNKFLDLTLPQKRCLP